MRIRYGGCIARPLVVALSKNAFGDLSEPQIPPL